MKVCVFGYTEFLSRCGTIICVAVGCEIIAASYVYVMSNHMDECVPILS